MIQECKFNPETDIQATVAGLSTDLAKAIESGVVLDTGSIGEFNDIEDPAGVWRRVGDAFEAMDIQRAIAKSGKARAAAKAAATAAAVSAPAATSSSE